MQKMILFFLFSGWMLGQTTGLPASSPSIPATTNLLKGGGVVDGVGPAIPGTDYIAPIQQILNSTINAPGGNLPTTTQLTATYSNYPTYGQVTDPSFGVFTINALDKGSNYNFSGSWNKTTWINSLFNLNRYTTGQSTVLSLQGGAYGAPGDLVGLSVSNTSFSAPWTYGDESSVAQETYNSEGLGEVIGTVSSFSASTNTIALSLNSGGGSQGVGRFLYDTSQGGDNTGTISAITPSPNTGTAGQAPIVTGSGTGWTLSTVIGTLGTAVVPALPGTPPGPVTVSPSAFSVGSMSNITTTTLICVYDQTQPFETVVPTSVTGTSWTANFQYAHPATANFSAGGYCGSAIAFTADNQTAATIPTLGIYGTMRALFPIVETTSATSMKLWHITNGAWAYYTGFYRAGVGSQAYTIYPGAFVTSVQSGNALSNIWQVMPAPITWASGDTVDLALGNPTWIAAGNRIQMAKVYGNPFYGSALDIQMQGIWGGNDGAAVSINHNTPASWIPTIGSYLPMITTSSIWSYLINTNSEPQGGAFYFGCSGSCNSGYTIFRNAYSGGSSAFNFTESTQAYSFNFGSGGFYEFQAGNLTIPLGAKITEPHGTNAAVGIVTLSAGSATVTTSAIAAIATAGGSGDWVDLYPRNCTGVLKFSTVAGTSITITDAVSESCDVKWEISHIQ